MATRAYTDEQACTVMDLLLRFHGSTDAAERSKAFSDVLAILDRVKESAKVNARVDRMLLKVGQ